VAFRWLLISRAVTGESLVPGRPQVCHFLHCGLVPLLTGPVMLQQMERGSRFYFAAALAWVEVTEGHWRGPCRWVCRYLHRPRQIAGLSGPMTFGHGWFASFLAETWPEDWGLENSASGPGLDFVAGLSRITKGLTDWDESGCRMVKLVSGRLIQTGLYFSDLTCGGSYGGWGTIFGDGGGWRTKRRRQGCDQELDVHYLSGYGVIRGP
jgi:hypothetical protein